MSIESFFKLKEKKSSIRTEVIAGLTTFLTMSYIIAVNPGIMAEAGIPFSGALTATILVAAISSILMGLIADLPYALAPGMGINAFFTYTVVLGMGVSWQTALGAVFVSGIIFIILTIFKVREAIVKAIPTCVRLGVAAGIGLLLTFIGLKGASFIVCHPVTFVCMGKFTPEMLIFVTGLIFTLILENKKIKGSLLSGIIFTTLAAYIYGKIPGNTALLNIPQKLFENPDFSSAFFKMDIAGVFKGGMLGVVFTLLFTDMFDSISTFLGVSQVADLKDEKGEPKNLNKALLVDAISTTISGLTGTSSGTTYIESAAGVEQGGRSGLTAIIAGLLFLPFLYFSPLIGAIPAFATAPALVLVGFFMLRAVSQVNWNKYEEGIPAFLALILIPLTYSITQGISWSLIVYILLKIFNRNIKDIHPMLYIIVLFSALALYLA
jgi:AGZA family xanthine/uracil permease-like MFS transporter